MNAGPERSISLYYRDIEVGGTSDKEYHVSIMKLKGESAYLVQFQFGRRGGTMQCGTKTKNAVTLTEANAIYDAVVSEKTRNGYKPEAEYACAGPTVLKVGKAMLSPLPSVVSRYPVEKMEEISRDQADTYLKSVKYWLQKKEDGEYRQIQKTAAGAFIGYNKLGGAVELPAAMLSELMNVPAKTFWLAGEQIANTIHGFDLYEVDGEDLAKEPYSVRMTRLAHLLGMGELVRTVATATTTAQKASFLAAFTKARSEGVVFKRIDAAYRAGNSGQHVRFKFVKSISCHVTAVNVGGRASATLSLRDGSRWVEVCNVSTNGKGAIAKGDVVEVLFLYTTAGCRLYQPRIKERRNDVAVGECTVEQLKGTFKEGIAEAA